jgi:hypothetical protein
MKSEMMTERRGLNDEELDAVSGGCYVTCGDGKGRTGGGYKGWVAELVGTIRAIVYGT